jgi:hypothetical protein
LEIVNEFNGASAMVWVQFFGRKSGKWMLSVEAGACRNQRIKQNGKIKIFLNFKKDSEFSSKKEAARRLANLINEVPSELRSEFEEQAYYLRESIL